MRRLVKAILSAALLTGFGGGAGAQDYPSMSLKFAHLTPATFPGAPVDKWFAEEITKRSGGKIKVQVFWAESLGKARELLDLVRTGAIDMAATPAGYFPNELPLVGMTNSVMAIFDDVEQAVRVTSELATTNKAVAAELKKNNIFPVFFHGVNGYRTFCTKRIQSSDSFKGLKIRSWGEYVPILWQSLGATSVNVLAPEIYESLQRGTIDCAFWPNDVVYSNKLFEVAKFASDYHFGAIPTWPVWVNWKTFHEVWPENVRKLFLDVGKDAAAMDIRLMREADDVALKTMTDKHGVEVVKVSDREKLRKAVPDLLNVWVSKMEAKGLGKEAQEIAQYVNQSISKAK